MDKQNAPKQVKFKANRPYRVGNVFMYFGLTYIVVSCNKTPRETKFDLIIELDQKQAA